MDHEPRDKDPFDGLLEDIMTIILTAAISGILISYFLA